MGPPHETASKDTPEKDSCLFRDATDATSASLPCPFHCPRSGFHGFQCFPRPRRSRTLRVHLRPFAVLPQFLTSYFIIHHSSLHSSPRSGILWILVDSRPLVVLSRSTQLVERPSWSFRFSQQNELEARSTKQPRPSAFLGHRAVASPLTPPARQGRLAPPSRFPRTRQALPIRVHLRPFAVPSSTLTS